MDRFHLMTVFVAVAETEGFAAGARRLNMSPPAVTRAIASLEAQLGVKLFNRTTRYVRTTEAGQRYLSDARRILADLDAADEAAAGINTEPRGHLTITAPAMFGRMHVMPGIIEYLERYPNTQVSAVFFDRVVNLLEEGIDVGIRIGELPDSSMRALRVGEVRIITCAAPEYLAKNGIPKHPDELSEHEVITSLAGNSSANWSFPSTKSSQRLTSRLKVTTNDAVIAAAEQGLGIIRLLSYQVLPAVAEGKLQVILEDFEPTPQPVHIIHREGRFSSARVRAFIDLLAEQLRANQSIH
ncbi:Transcriptional regulator2C LysR family [gamma proteobacterium IMCC2047]|nr:Transcriptional regulator2C LysR family [gamma proteobacterium IMCC2047]